MEILKEFGRIGIIGIVAFLLTEGVLVQFVDLVGVKLTPDQKLQIVAVATMAIKAVDRWLHETGKAVRGLTRF